MAKFKINAGQGNEKTVEAAKFAEQLSLIVFFSPSSDQVYAIPTSRVSSIERIGD